jgi:hypothetical protein
MAELLTHILAAYVLFTAFGWAIEWLDPRWVVVGMVGSLFPDLNRIDMLIDRYLIESVLGVPFRWGAIHTLGGVVLLAVAGAVLFETARARRRAFGMLLAGGASHLVIDAVKQWANGVNGAYLYPVTWWRNPTPSWYVSTDRWVLGVALACALVVFFVDRRAWIRGQMRSE